MLWVEKLLNPNQSNQRSPIYSDTVSVLRIKERLRMYNMYFLNHIISSKIQFKTIKFNYSLVRICQLEHLADLSSGFQKFVLRDLPVRVQVALAEVRLDLLQQLGLCQRLALKLVQRFCYPGFFDNSKFLLFLERRQRKMSNL